MIRRKKIHFVFLSVAFICLNQTVFGCQCASFLDIRDKKILDYYLQFADLVFSGKVEKLENQYLSKKEIEVIKTKARSLITKKAIEESKNFRRNFYAFIPSLFWRGAVKSEVLIFTGQITSSYVGMGPNSCAYTFEVGESYLVFAKKVEDFFEVSICGGTRKLSISQPALDLLGRGKKYKPWYVFW